MVVLWTVQYSTYLSWGDITVSAPRYPRQGIHCVGFYPYFQADCQQFEQLSRYKSSNFYALSSIISQTLCHYFALWLIQFTQTTLRSANWFKIAISSRHCPHSHGACCVSLKCVINPIYAFQSTQSHCDKCMLWGYRLFFTLCIFVNICKWIYKVTRKHSSRVCTTCLPTICALVSTRCQYR